MAETNELGTAALRLNPKRPCAPEAAQAFTESPVPWCKNGWYIKEGTRPGLSLLHRMGAYYIQEASAMAPASVLDVQSNELALDMCAAPGGKTGQLAAACRALISNEIVPKRASILSSTVERMGITNTVVTSAAPEQLSAALPPVFDALLVDAPCSGEGMFRKNPNAKDEWTDNTPAGCAKRQAHILDCAASLIKEGGRLVYSTCTFSKEENEDSVESFLCRHPQFELRDFALNGLPASENGMLRIHPDIARGEGQFMALMVNTAPVENLPKKKKSRGKPEKPVFDIKEVMKRLGDIVPSIENITADSRLVLFGDTLLAVPDALPEIDGINLIRFGLRLCKVGSGRKEGLYVIPDHALAMAMQLSDAAGTLDLSEDELLRFIDDGTLSSDRTGWQLVTCCGMPAGWAKGSAGMVKSHIPRTLQ